MKRGVTQLNHVTGRHYKQITAQKQIWVDQDQTYYFLIFIIQIFIQNYHYYADHSGDPLKYFVYMQWIQKP
jgi:hypothetical protein